MTSLVLPDRKRAIVLLAEHLYDSLASPKGQRFHAGTGQSAPSHYEPCLACGGSWRTGSVTGRKYGVNAGDGWVVDRFHAGTGQSAPSHYEPCLACGGSWRTGSVTGRKYGVNAGDGWVVDRFHRKRPCEACGGRTDEDGTQHKGSGRIGMDRMTGRKVGTEEAPAKRSSSWTCNFCFGLGVKHGQRCEPCEGSGRREHSPFVLAGVSDSADETLDFELPALDRAILERDKAGDFHRLDVALAELARRSPHYWRTFHALHVVKTKQDFDLDFRERVWLQQAYAGLLNLMPREIRVPRDLVYAARNDRKGTLMKARGNGAPLTVRDEELRRLNEVEGRDPASLASEFGLSTRQVQRILYGATA